MASLKEDTKTIDSLISAAAKKVSAKKENDICRYIPVPTGGYIHHFTMRKMKTEAPEELHALVTKHIINVPAPTKVTPKRRAARGSRKRRDQFVFTKFDIEKMLNMARIAGDKEMIRKLTPKKDLRTVKRELISSIRHGKVDQDLWQFYCEVVACMQAISAGATTPC